MSPARCPLLCLALAGCTPYVPDGSANTGAVEVAVVATPPPAGGPRFTTFAVHLDEIVVDGRTPSGERESVGVLVDAAFTPLDAQDAVGFRLERGAHAEVTLGFVFDAVDALAVLAGGELDDDDGFRLEVDRVALSFEVPQLSVGATPVAGRLVFDPAAWVGALGLGGGDDDDDTTSTGDDDDDTTSTSTGDDDDDTSTSDTGDDDTGDDTGNDRRGAKSAGDDDDDDVVVIGPGSAAYEQLLRAIADTTTLELDGAEVAP